MQQLSTQHLIVNKLVWKPRKFQLLWVLHTTCLGAHALSTGSSLLSDEPPPWATHRTRTLPCVSCSFGRAPTPQRGIQTYSSLTMVDIQNA